jgi:hypothetical protein
MAGVDKTRVGEHVNVAFSVMGVPQPLWDEVQRLPKMDCVNRCRTVLLEMENMAAVGVKMRRVVAQAALACCWRIAPATLQDEVRRGLLALPEEEDVVLSRTEFVRVLREAVQPYDEETGREGY